MPNGGGDDLGKLPAKVEYSYVSTQKRTLYLFITRERRSNDDGVKKEFDKIVPTELIEINMNTTKLPTTIRSAHPNSREFDTWDLEINWLQSDIIKLLKNALGKDRAKVLLYELILGHNADWHNEVIAIQS